MTDECFSTSCRELMAGFGSVGLVMIVVYGYFVFRFFADKKPKFTTLNDELFV